MRSFMVPVAMETVSEAVERLSRAGYGEQFRATERGLTDRRDVVHDPAHMIVDEFVRFEGASDPDDEAVVFALRDGIDGLRGTYTVAYGAEMDPLDAEMVRRLRGWIPDYNPGLARHGEDD